MRLLTICMLAGASFVAADKHEGIRSFESVLPLSEAYVPDPSSTVQLDSKERRDALAASAFTWPRKERIQARQITASSVQATKLVGRDAASTEMGTPGPPPPPGAAPPPSPATVPSSPAPAKPGTDVCWETSPCKDTMRRWADCRSSIGAISDPNQVGPISTIYQSCMCVPGFNDVYGPYPTDRLPKPFLCTECLHQAGIDTTTSNGAFQTYLDKLWGFCHIPNPNMVDLLLSMMDWVAFAKLPETLSLLPDSIKTLTALRAQLSSTSGMNVPTSVAIVKPTDGFGKFPPAKTTGSMTMTQAGATQFSVTATAMPRPRDNDPNTPWWSSTLTSGDTIPTEYLAQLPSNWPYTEYGIARKAGKTTSWPLVNPNATSSTVAWVYHELLWNPRPLYTPAAEKAKKGKMYNPGLEGWKHDFLYDTITPSVTLPDSTSTSSVSDFRPSNSQGSVLSADAARAAALSASMAAVTGTADADAKALSELAEEVKSMKSRLNA